MGKRGNGEGTIVQRDDGRWVAAVSAEDGKRKWLYGKTRKEVAEKLKVTLRDQQKGMLLIGPSQTLGTYLTRWLDDSVKDTVRPRTYDSYSQLVRTHYLPDAISKKSLAKLSPQDVQAFLRRKSQTELSPRTVQYLHAILRRALGQAEKWGLVARNVARLVDPPRVVRSEIQPFTLEEARHFLDVASANRLEALYTVAVALGLRQGEALGLRWEDIDFDQTTLRVHHSLQRIEGKLTLVEPKTARSRRTLALPEFAVSSLRNHRKRQLEERLAAGSLWQEAGFVFTTSLGTPIDAHNLGRYFKALLRQADLPDLRFHDLRHTCATLLVAQGVHPRVVMGDARPQPVWDHHEPLRPCYAQRDAANQINALLGPKSQAN